MIGVRAWSAAGLGLALLTSPLGAQRWLTLDAGGGALTHQFAPSSEAVTLASRLGWITPRTWLQGGALYSRGTELLWNAEADVTGGLAAPLGRSWSLGMDGIGIWTAHHQGEGTREIQLLPSLRFDPRPVSLRLSLGFGQASTYGPAQRFALGRLEAAGFIGPIDLRGRVSRTDFSEDVIRATEIWISNGPRPDSALRRLISHYHDVEFRAGWARSRFSLQGGVQRRLGTDGFDATGWHIEATGWLNSSLALFGSSGRTLSRLTVDLPARRYATLGVRWLITSRMPASASQPAVRPTGFRAESTGEGVRLLMPAGGAGLVELIGDFTQWEPVPMLAQRDGWWVLNRSLPAGLYRVNVRIDGGPWLVPPGLPSEDDGLGGRSGLLLIP